MLDYDNWKLSVNQLLTEKYSIDFSDIDEEFAKKMWIYSTSPEDFVSNIAKKYDLEEYHR